MLSDWKIAVEPLLVAVGVAVGVPVPVIVDVAVGVAVCVVVLRAHATWIACLEECCRGDPADIWPTDDSVRSGEADWMLMLRAAASTRNVMERVRSAFSTVCKMGSVAGNGDDAGWAPREKPLPSFMVQLPTPPLVM